jgi:hypothetical protein
VQLCNQDENYQFKLKVSNLPIAIYFKCETRMGTIVKNKVKNWNCRFFVKKKKNHPTLEFTWQCEPLQQKLHLNHPTQERYVAFNSPLKSTYRSLLPDGVY